MWAWRQRVRGALLDYAVNDLPRGKVRRDWKAKAHAFAGCGRIVSSLACDGCNGVNMESGTLVASCGLRICPICARRKAQKLRHKLRTAWDQSRRQGNRNHLYFLTFTMKFDVADPEAVSAEGLLRRKNEMMAAWSSVWRQYLKPLNKKPLKKGEPRPPVDYAACRSIEVGTGGMVHLHVLYMGARPDVNVLRWRWEEQLPGSYQLDAKHCKDAGKAIVELAKYVTKGASPAKSDVVGGTPGAFMDPRLAVNVEIAFSGDRLVQCYGAWLGIQIDDDEDTDEEKAEERELYAAPCKECGLVGEWHAHQFTIEEWQQKFRGQLALWKPRISGSGPRHKPRGDDPDAKHPDSDPQPPIHLRKRRRSRYGRPVRPGDAACRSWATPVELPSWTNQATRVDTSGSVGGETEH